MFGFENSRQYSETDILQPKVFHMVKVCFLYHQFRKEIFTTEQSEWRNYEVTSISQMQINAAFSKPTKAIVRKTMIFKILPFQVKSITNM